MKKLLLIISVALLVSCQGEPPSVEQKGDFKLQLLFEKDGCKVYRFHDGGHSVYWTDCRGKVESLYQQQSGKTNHEVRIQNQTTQ